MELVTLKRSEILEIMRALSELGKNSKLPFEIRQNVSRTLRSLKGEAEETNTLQRELLDEYALTTEEGTYKTTENGNICFRAGTAEEYKAKNNDLMDEQVEIKMWPIAYSQLKKIEISANAEAILLDTFIVDEDKPKPTAEKEE